LGTLDTSSFLSNITTLANTTSGLSSVVDGSSSTKTSTAIVASGANYRSTVQSRSSSQVVGCSVTDSTIQPYIRPRIVAFRCHALKPGANIHVFCDGVNVDQYCAPGHITTDPTIDSSCGSMDYNCVDRDGTWGDDINCDDKGECVGHFNIPEQTFRTGEHTFEFADVNDLVNKANNITCYGKGGFTAGDIPVTKQMSTPSTVNPGISSSLGGGIISTIVIDSGPITNNATVITPTPAPTPTLNDCDPYSQIFTVTTPNGEAGIHGISLDLFFKSKSLTSNTGVTSYICEVANGVPDSTKILPYSQCHMDHDKVNISDDASEKTTFAFDSHVFMCNDKDYAFVVCPDGDDPDYQLHHAQYGNNCITTGNPVYNLPNIGSCFYGGAGSQWIPIPNECCKFNLNRANFTQSAGICVHNNDDHDYLYLHNNLSLTGNFSINKIIPGDICYGATSTSPATCNLAVKGELNFHDDLDNIAHIKKSTGFFNTVPVCQFHRFPNSSVSTPNSSTLVCTANVFGCYDPKMNACMPKYSILAPAGTQFSHSCKRTTTSRTSVSKDTQTPPSLYEGSEVEFHDNECAVLSKSNETSYTSNTKSLTIQTTLQTDSSLISPIINRVQSSAVIIENLIDPISSNYNEFFNYGASQSKYISQIVTLAAGQDSQDIVVYLTAYRPPGTDIQVWVKFLNAEDTDPISAKTWAPLRNTGLNMYSSPTNANNYHEFSFVTCSYYPMLQCTGTITANTASPNVAGSSTLFTTELQTGWWISSLGNTSVSEELEQIVSIQSNTSMILDSSFLVNHISNNFFLVAPPTTPWVSTSKSKQITGTVTANSGSAVVTGSATNFQTDFNYTSIIGINGDQQKIVSIANSTSLTVGAPWSSNVSGANAYNVTTSGLTYLNSNNMIFTSFKQFQIKIILQSNNTAVVPILKDLRAIYLQL